MLPGGPPHPGRGAKFCDDGTAVQARVVVSSHAATRFRTQYYIVKDGQLAGAGKASYQPGNTTTGNDSKTH